MPRLKSNISRLFFLLLLLAGFVLILRMAWHDPAGSVSHTKRLKKPRWTRAESARMTNHPGRMKSVQEVGGVKSTFNPEGTVEYSNTAEPGKTEEIHTLLSSTKWEELARNDPALSNWTSCANAKFSFFNMTGKKDSYRVGDVVTVDITLRDFNGKRKNRGGDVVRILATNKSHNSHSIGYVIDRHDGTYIGVVKLLWAGYVTIDVVVGAPRELIRLMYHNVRIGKQRRPIMGKFTDRRNTATVECTPIDSIARSYKEVCNLTHRNADLPWYCEKPGNISCDNWETVYEEREINFTDQEQLMITSVNNSKMSTSVNLKVEKGTSSEDHFVQKSKLPPCNKLPVRVTWNTTSPVAYLYSGTWFSTQCMVTFDGSNSSYEKCFHGKKVWLLGDSNMREVVSHFIKVMNLTLITEKWTKKKWHKASLASNKDGSIFVFWAIHALPQYAREQFANGTHQYIDSIPANSKDVVVVHFYMHFQPFHPSAVRNHIRKTAQSIKALKSRAPDTKVVVRGSHVLFLPYVISHFNDFWGYVYDQILKEEFSSLMDDVIFLDFWDITAAVENTSMHPAEEILVQGIRYMMSFLCP